MGFNMIRERSHKGNDFEKFKSRLEKIVELAEKLCDDVEEMEEEFGERDDDERNYKRYERDYNEDYDFGERGRGRSRGMMGSRRG